MKKFIWSLLCAVLAVGGAEAKLKALIVDGQNNHAVWPKSTIMMKQYLEETGLFEVDVDRVRYIWKSEREAKYLPMAGDFESEAVKQPKSDPDFKPNFSDYDVIISNFGWKAANLSKETEKALEEYMLNGGGFVSVHAADNAWPQWIEFNKMIGVGGWGGRNEKSGPMVYFNDQGKEVRDTSPGNAGSHGPQHEFPIVVRAPEHPVMKGLPKSWLTSKDECYANMRGPALNMTVLATGEDQGVEKRKGKHQPMLMAIDYGQGRCFHTTLGHDTPAFEGVGFITTFVRGCEWAASGKVTIPVPDDFPTADAVSRRPFKLK
ncbi:ThuA domain-containing protein [Pontiella agarivorans]|uniref:ThuA domain-containing protein n=1 Tax=Pontiella agarivorans TaxID=3038953 RepID=A0ABU5N1N8_9BACT|nr:ThuA domain-containing protein [Pontiella agarivorans]MDZ8120327.1 ThuA domain-containing protein [Pontiella agarivorans]